MGSEKRGISWTVLLERYARTAIETCQLQMDIPDRHSGVAVAMGDARDHVWPRNTPAASATRPTNPASPAPPITSRSVARVMAT